MQWFAAKILLKLVPKSGDTHLLFYDEQIRLLSAESLNDAKDKILRLIDDILKQANWDPNDIHIIVLEKILDVFHVGHELTDCTTIYSSLWYEKEAQTLIHFYEENE